MRFTSPPFVPCVRKKLAMFVGIVEGPQLGSSPLGETGEKRRERKGSRRRRGNEFKENILSKLELIQYVKVIKEGNNK